MYQAFLLWALYCLVCRVEIGYQNPRKVFEQGLNDAAFPGWSIKVGDLFHAGENPDITVLALYAGAGLVNVQEAAATQPFQETIIDVRVALRCRRLELVDSSTRDVETK